MMVRYLDGDNHLHVQLVWYIGDLYDIKVIPEQIFKWDCVFLNKEMPSDINQNGDSPKSDNILVPAKKMHKFQQTWIYQMYKLKIQQKT